MSEEKVEAFSVPDDAVFIAIRVAKPLNDDEFQRMNQSAGLITEACGLPVFLFENGASVEAVINPQDRLKNLTERLEVLEQWQLDHDWKV